MKKEPRKILAEQYPAIAAEWHPTKNGNLTSSDVTIGTKRKVWWQCSGGHEWEATVASRSLLRSGCPVCFRKKALEGGQDLASRYPAIAAEWHPMKNGDLTPKDIAASSHKKIWWRCSNGHEWKTAVGNRTLLKSGCPICTGQKVLAGYNDLSSKRPAIAAEWHRTKNGDLTSQDVTVGSGKKVWWQCSEGHEWEATVASRVLLRSGCPICFRKKALEGSQDLASRYPAIAAEWHQIKNGDLRPQDVTAGSGKKVWWQCSEGHEWEAIVANRVLRGSGCPVCANRKRTMSRLKRNQDCAGGLQIPD